MDDVVLERALALSAHHFELILMPTEKCNFRCTYCYEDFAIGRMKDETVRGVMALIARRAGGLRSLNIGWFGGEPTLAVDIVERVNGHALSVRPEEMRFTSSMSTNGWLLTPDVLRRLLAVEVRVFQISLDGDQAEHDTTRLTRGGQGTFDRVFGNVRAALAGDDAFKIALRIHARRGNWASVERLVERIAAAFGGDPRVTAYVKAIERLGGPNDAAIDLLDDHGRVERMNHHLDEIGLLEGRAEPTICYAAKANSLLIRADGRVGKCTVALADGRNTIGQMLPSGDLSIDNALFRPWIRGLLSGDEAALHCPLHGL